MVNPYLVLAYILLWTIFVLYAWVIQRRQRRLEKRLEELETALREREPRGAEKPGTR